MVLEIEMKEEMEDKQEESYKKKRRIYVISNYVAMKFSMKLNGRK